MIGAIIGGFLGVLFLSAISENNKEENNYKTEMRELSYENGRKEGEALELFNLRKNEILFSFTNQLTDALAQNLDFCKKEMEDQYNNYNQELDNIIEKITSIENRENLFISRLNESMEKLSIEMGQLEVKHLNILLVGPWGVGKSFLINTILKENVAETKLSKPTTKNFSIYNLSIIQIFVYLIVGELRKEIIMLMQWLTK